MAGITILPGEQSSGAQIANALGSGFNTGLSGMLNQLAAQRAQQMQVQRTGQALSALGLIAPEQAQAAGYLPESALTQLVKQKLQEPREQAYASALQQLLGVQQTSPIEQGVSQEAQVAQPGLPEMININKGSAPKIPAGLTGQQATKLAELGLQQQKTAREEQYRVKKLELEEKKLAKAQEREAFKATQKLRETIHKEARTAKQSLDDLNRMEELEKEGKLDTPGYAEFLKRSGLDIPALMNPGSEEFNKIVGNFQRGAKDIYGGRITNFELENFLKILPNLSQSPEGRKRVISNLKRLYRGNLAYKEAANKIISENKGIPPMDLMEKLDEKVDPLLNKISEQFKKDLAKPVPEGQNKLITAAQSVAGSAAGKAGSLAKLGAGAYTGYKVGKFFGPIGGLAGGALGSLLGLSGLIGE